MDSDEGGGGRGGQSSLRSQVGRAVSARGRTGTAGPVLGAAARCQPHSREPSGGDRGLATVALHRHGDRRAAGDGREHRVGDPHADRDGPAGAPRPGAGCPPGWRAWGTHAARAKQRGYHHPRHHLGWEYVHIAIDDATRMAYAEVLDDERATTAAGFLRRVVRFYAGYGIQVQAVMTDNGNAYRSSVHALCCRTLRLKHLRTRTYRPQTNGKAERFIRTMLAEWAYAAIYRHSTERTRALDGFLWRYNHQRKHSALRRRAPAARLDELRTNLLGSYI